MALTSAISLACSSLTGFSLIALTTASFSVSVIGRAFCLSGSAALNADAQRSVFPPITGIFSKTSTFLTPKSLAVTAAERPAPPAPTMMRSALPLVIPATFLIFSGTGFWKAAMSPPAFSIAWAMAVFRAVLVTVAPATLSTLSVWY